MEYPDLLQKLVASDFRRVERDDRLLDVFPGEDREKGIELWEKWEKETIKIVRIHLPFSDKKTWFYQIPRQDIEQALLKNDHLLLAEYQPVNLSDSSVS